MAERLPIQNDNETRDDAEASLQRLGILPINGPFTEQQLSRELSRRGWQWQIDANGIIATKAYTSSGAVKQQIRNVGPDRLKSLAEVLVKAIRFDEERGLSLIGPVEADVVVRAPNGRVIAIVEAKGGDSPTEDVASRYRLNLVGASTAFALTPFFLMFWHDVGYLWDQRTGVFPTWKAPRTLSMAPVIAHYLPWLEDAERPGEAEIGLAVAAWFKDLANADPNHPAPTADVFEGTDFLEALQGASIATDSRV